MAVNQHSFRHLCAEYYNDYARYTYSYYFVARLEAIFLLLKRLLPLARCIHVSSLLHMQRIQTSLLALCFMLCGSLLHAQSLEADTQVALAHTRTQALEANFDADDLAGLAVDYAYTDEKVGITYIYLKQQVGTIAIDQAIATIGMKDGKVFSYVHRLVPQVSEKLTSVVPVLNDANAVRVASSHFGQTAPSQATRSSAKLGPQGQRYFAEPDYVNSPISVQDFYELGKDKKLHRVLGVTLDLKNGDYQRVSVDAISGNVLSVQNYTLHCSFGHDYLAPHHTGACDEVPADFKSTTTTAMVNDGSSYRVFAWPAESPNHGPHVIVNNPADSIASPFGWHDTNGVDGPEFTITRGNNTHAFIDGLDTDTPSEAEPDGGASLTFDFPYDVAEEPSEQTLTTTTNLFYAVNQMHDFAYQYGFDEQGGNFQANNYGNGGAANDAVSSQSQDGAITNTTGDGPDTDHINNANFATPGDGSSGRMQMFLWNSNAGGNPIVAAQPAQVADRTYGDLGIAADGFGFGATVDSNTMVRAGIVDALDDVENQDLNDICEDIVNASDIDGKIALINRGGCEFGSKALRAQEAGAVAVIICNFEDDIINMAGGADGTQVNIPIFMLTFSGCLQLRTDAATFPDFELAIEMPDDTGTDFVSGSFDNGIVAHEFGHGISTRLTGGPNTSCLGSAEQMGEGWSDFFGLVTSVRPGDDGALPRGIGTFATRETTSGRGIRPFPYSTDMSVNPVTYAGVADASTFSQPHGIGSIWCSMIWDLHWAMVDVYGFSDDVFHGDLGNNRAIQLVMTGMKLQPCSPGFEDGRDAILEADRMLYNGENQKLIWEVFARRGLGVDASQGDPNDRADGVINFGIPPDLANEAFFSKTATPTINAGDDVDVELVFANFLDEAVQNATITDLLPAGASLVSGSVNLPFTQSGDVLTFEFENLSKGDEETITYSYTSPSDVSTLVWYEPVVDNSSRREFEADNIIPTGLTDWEITDVDGFGDSFSWNVIGDIEETQPILAMTEDQEFVVSGDNPVFSFQHKFGVNPTHEGAILEIYTGTTGRFTPLANDRILRGNYTTPVLYQAFVIPFLDGYAGVQDEFEQVLVDLSDFAGETVRMRWRYGREDGGTGDAGEGWTLDEFAAGNAIMYNTTAELQIDNLDVIQAAAPDVGTFVNFDASSSTSVAPDGFNKFRAFPNPTGGEVNLQWEGDLGAGTVEIHNATGQIVTSVRVAPGEQRMLLDLTSQAPGLYTVRTVRSGVEQTLRVVVQ